MPDDFCKGKHNLRSVHIKTLERIIFICIAELAPDFSNTKKSLASYLSPFKINDVKVACIKNYLLRGNWKLVAENFRKCYHCDSAHPEYCSTTIGANLKENTDELTCTKQKDWNARELTT
jgi:glycine betaine catabolism A